MQFRSQIGPGKLGDLGFTYNELGRLEIKYKNKKKPVKKSYA